MTAPTQTVVTGALPLPETAVGWALDEWGAALALARAEGWRLLRSPAMLPAAMLLVMSSFGSPPLASLGDLARQSSFPCLMVAAMTMVAVNLAVRRPRRHGTDEVYGAAPISAAARTGGHLLSVLWPAAATAFALVLQLLYWKLGRDAHGSFSPADLAIGPILVLGAGMLAVLVTRLWPSVLVIPVTCAGIVAVEVWASTPRAATTGVASLAFWVTTEAQWILPPRPASVHVVYLLALTALAAVTALFLSSRRRHLVGLAGLALAVAVTAGVIQLRSISPAAWAKVDRALAAQDAGQVCRLRNGLRYCAYTEDAGLIPEWARAVDGVRRAVPADRFPTDLAVSERISLTSLQYVDRASRARLTARLPHLDALRPVDDGRLHPSPSFAWERLSSLDLAAGTASRALGLPLVPGPANELCDAAGQGRAVVALWLTGQSTPRATRQLERLAKEGIAELGGKRYVLFAGDTVLYGGVAWGETETALALALLDRPALEVSAAITRGWSLLTAPASTTADVARTLGLDPGARLPAPTGALADLGPQAGPVHLSGPCP